MALLNRSDLQYEYQWTAHGGDDPRVSGEPDSTLLNRNEGYEVLYFINKFAELHSLSNIASGHKIEKMIQEGVPSNIRSQKKIQRWILDNWDNW